MVLPLLPQEIWQNIAAFVKPTLLEDLMAVNSVFFNVAMDCKYRQLSFAFLDQKMVRTLVRLKDPYIAKRVRVVHVYPGFLKQAMDLPRNPLHPRRPFRTMLSELATAIFDQRLGKSGPTIPKLKSPEDVVNALLDVFEGLPNVTDYHIKWSGLHGVPESPVPLLTSLFRPQLRRLSLDISLENVVQLFSIPPTCECDLEELDLLIRVDSDLRSAYDYIPKIMIEHLAPAIGRFKHSLRKLNIFSWESLDLSHLFLGLPVLPRLEHITLGIPVNNCQLGPPVAVANFLQSQSASLRSLSLRATQYGGAGYPMFTNVEQFDKWFQDAFSQVHLPHLREFNISSPLFTLPASLTCIRRFASTIRSLDLTGRFHNYSDICSILACFMNRPRNAKLESLRLGSVDLTPELLDLLAMELPGLQRLDLIVRNKDNPVPSLDRFGRDIELEDFNLAMMERSYPDWDLRHLNIIITGSLPDLHTMARMQRALAQSIPGVSVTF